MTTTAPPADVYQPPKRKGFALTALILGICALPLCFLLVPAILAIVFGIIALVKGQSKGMAITGLVLGGVSFILIPVVAIIAAIAMPSLLESRTVANELAAQATLKHLHGSQVLFQATAQRDANQNGLGEYGLLDELRQQDRNLPGQNEAKHGYRFAAILPMGDSGYVTSRDTAVPADAVATQERAFLIVAWPELPGHSGRQVFCLSEDAQVRAPGSADAAAILRLFSQDPVDAGQIMRATRPDGWTRPVPWPIAAR